MYALRTRPPVTIADPLDLHVLGLPLAFILSQDQTLHSVLFIYPKAEASRQKFHKMKSRPGTYFSQSYLRVLHKAFRYQTVNELFIKT